MSFYNILNADESEPKNKEDMKMRNVTINGNSTKAIGDKSIHLNNGNLVLHYNKLGEVINAFIVTSFRDGMGKYPNDSTGSYCSLINLDTGYIQFEERCSRNTTVRRVLSHLNPNDHEGKGALECGQYIEVYTIGNYKIDLSFEKKSC